MQACGRFFFFKKINFKTLTAPLEKNEVTIQDLPWFIKNKENGLSRFLKILNLLDLKYNFNNKN